MWDEYEPDEKTKSDDDVGYGDYVDEW